MPEEILASVQVRRDSKANWESVNPILLNGEAAYEQDTDMFKIGDGVKRYSDLPYHNKVGPQGKPGPTPQISMNVSTGNPGTSASVSVTGTAENPVINLTVPRGDTGKTGSTGPKGDTGSSGVYIGTSQPTDSNINVWIDSDGEPTEVIDDFAREEIGRLKSEIPTTLPNPNKLKLTGAVTAEYDGSSEVSVKIPEGGSGGYTLPIASPTTLGGVQPATKTDDMTQAVGVDDAGGLWTAPGSGGGGNWITVGDVTLTEETSEIRFDWKNSVYPFGVGRIYVLNAHLVGAAGAESELDVKQQGVWPGLGSDSGWLFGNNLYKVPADGMTNDIVETAIAFDKTLGSGGQVIRFVNGVQSLSKNFDKNRCQGVKFIVSGNFGVGTKYKLMFKDL